MVLASSQAAPIMSSRMHHLLATKTEWGAWGSNGISYRGTMLDSYAETARDSGVSTLAVPSHTLAGAHIVFGEVTKPFYQRAQRVWELPMSPMCSYRQWVTCASSAWAMTSSAWRKQSRRKCKLVTTTHLGTLSPATALKEAAPAFLVVQGRNLPNLQPKMEAWTGLEQ